jgi:hypothetical protein
MSAIYCVRMRDRRFSNLSTPDWAAYESRLLSTAEFASYLMLTYENRRAHFKSSLPLWGRDLNQRHSRVAGGEGDSGVSKRARVRGGRGGGGPP